MHARMLPPLGLRDLLLKREVPRRPRSPMYAGREPTALTWTQNVRTLVLSRPAISQAGTSMGEGNDCVEPIRISERP